MLQVRHALSIHRDPGFRSHPAHLEPNPFAGPGGRDIRAAAVVRRSHVYVIERPGDTVERQPPGATHARLADALRLPTTGDFDLADAVPIRLVPTGPQAHAPPPHELRVRHEIPLASQRENLLERGNLYRMDNCGRGRPRPPMIDVLSFDRRIGSDKDKEAQEHG